jgi:hypothetical protein
MARPTRDERYHSILQEALSEYDRVYEASQDERRQSVEDRRFASISGAQWEGPWGEMFENKPRPEINKVQNALIRIENEYRNNRITVDFVAKDGVSNTELADVCDGLYRADEQDSCANEAYDNAFQEGTAGGMGAWRLKACYDDEEDDENDYQRIRFEPIFDADTSVFFDIDAKRQDKSDAKRCWVLYSMTPEAFEEEWADKSVASWPKDDWTTFFDWDTPDVVYVAEYYRVEEVNETVRTFAGIEDEKKYTDAELEEMGEEAAGEQTEEKLTRSALIQAGIDQMASQGYVEIKKRTRKVRRVHKYIMSGAAILEDCGFIAGKYIPIIPFYGKRWFVDNIERFMGVTRLVKDLQRLKNMLMAWLAEIAAQGTIEMPIFTPEQMLGHEVMWSEANFKRYGYMLVNPVTSLDGQEQAAGPIGYTKSPQIPPAMAALLQLVDIDMAEILGNQQNGEKMVSNISGKVVEKIQQRLDMMAFIYMSNFAKAMQWCGTVWLSMAKDLYVEEKRKMKMIGEMSNVESVELGEPLVDLETGDLTTRNDLTKANFDVVSEVGPSFQSQKDALIASLQAQMQTTTDPADQKILNYLIMMNTDGTGMGDVKEYARKQLVAMGVLQPNEEEAKAMEEATANQQPNPQDQYLLSEAAKSAAAAEDLKAATILKGAQTEKVIAEAGETHAEMLLKLKEAHQPEQVE